MLRHADRLKIALAQLDLLVGDVRGNLERVIAEARRARDELQADLVLFPELTLSGYPPEDLLFHRGLRLQIGRALDELTRAVPEIGVMVGYPEYAPGHIYNAACLIRGGRVLAQHRKACLPNYKVFDEKRYFTAGTEATVVDFDGFRLGLLICEDAWEPQPAAQARALGAEALLIINASPYEIHKQRQREQVIGERVRETGVPAAYVNLIGGQDELVFDGNSFAMNAQGQIALRAPPLEEGLYCLEFERRGGLVAPLAGDIAPEWPDERTVYRVLVLGVRDYVNKTGFTGAVIGLSGGVDSALTLAIAVDALGADRVHAVMMPSRYTSNMSREDAAAQAQTLGVSLSSISIENMFAATLDALENEFAGCAADATEENIQARCRGVLLMAISNKTGRILLTTGNKSEMSVGYATLYGDMCGGYNVLKDIYKTEVFRLSRWRNQTSPAGALGPRGRVIPERIIEKPPSAELKPDQTDQDSLPPYDVLDGILECLVERECSFEETVAKGYDPATV